MQGIYQVTFFAFINMLGTFLCCSVLPYTHSVPQWLSIIPSNEEKDCGFKGFALNAVNLRLSAALSNGKDFWNMSSIILDSPVMPIGPKFSELLIDANSGFNHPSESQLFLSFLILLSLSQIHLNVTPFWFVFVFSVTLKEFVLTAAELCCTWSWQWRA